MTHILSPTPNGLLSVVSFEHLPPWVALGTAKTTGLQNPSTTASQDLALNGWSGWQNIAMSIHKVPTPTTNKKHYKSFLCLKSAMITISILMASHYILLLTLLSLPESSNYQSLLYLVTSI